MRLATLQIGRYYLAGANTTYNSYERIKCSKSVVHPGWSAKHGRNDISLCFLDSASRITPVTLSKGKGLGGKISVEGSPAVAN
jgi:hypothetical protein